MSKTLVSRTVLNKPILAAALIALLMPFAGAQAGTVVRELDETTLLVTEFRGKPPHKRFIVNADNTAAFARYQEIMDQPAQRLFAGVFGGGAPGKSIQRVRRAPDADASEQVQRVEFARFEETEADDKATRRFWRGAPGKGLPSVTD